MDALDFLKEEEVKAFIQKNVSTDVSQFLLNPPKKWKSQANVIADQLLSRNKAKEKLPSWVENFHLIFPPPLSIEQASSEATARYKAGLLRGTHLVDLTGGTGIDCLWMGENFKRVTYVEQDDVLCSIFKHNANTLQKRVEVIHDSAEGVLDTFDGKATFYLDPARRGDRKQRVFKLEDCTPNLLALQHTLNEKSKKTLVKLSPLIDLTHLTHAVQRISEVHVVSVRNECKEVLLLIEADHKESAPKIIAVNLNSGQPRFSFEKLEEERVQISYDKASTYIYEPNTSILKAGGFKSIAERYQLKKLNRNTHLYTSNSQVEDFPGKIFKVLTTDGKGSLQKYLENGHINVMTRNHPLSAAQLKKKYNLKDGGRYYLIGFRGANNKPQLIIANRFR